MKAAMSRVEREVGRIERSLKEREIIGSGGLSQDNGSL